MIRLVVSVLLMSGIATGASAEKLPGGTLLDGRVRETRFVDGQVYRLKLGQLRATTVEFEPGEKVVSVVAGDTEAFQFDLVPGDRVLTIKPVEGNVQTNVTVYTTQRAYYFYLTEGRSPFYVVRFTYPERKKDRSRAVGKRRKNSAYGVSERNEITPVTVWDDGAFTYFRFRQNAPIPAIFKVRGGYEHTVNSTKIDGNIMRVSGTSRQWAVRLGEIEVCISELIDG